MIEQATRGVKRRKRGKDEIALMNYLSSSSLQPSLPPSLPALQEIVPNVHISLASPPPFSLSLSLYPSSSPPFPKTPTGQTKKQARRSEGGYG
jgi:hypothetical protein